MFFAEILGFERCKGFSSVFVIVFCFFFSSFPTWGSKGAKDCTFCRSREMLKNAPTLAIVAVHTEEYEPLKIWGDLFNLIQFGPY